mmetsp:Transcript_628/g.2479  ORF Transcript_628/g.2479 Transcript_628/m.2479 type:complete len:544 (-) Transcript_628:386-2017(-)
MGWSTTTATSEDRVPFQSERGGEAEDMGRRKRPSRHYRGDRQKYLHCGAGAFLHQHARPRATRTTLPLHNTRARGLIVLDVVSLAAAAAAPRVLVVFSESRSQQGCESEGRLGQPVAGVREPGVGEGRRGGPAVLVRGVVGGGRRRKTARGRRRGALLRRRRRRRRGRRRGPPTTPGDAAPGAAELDEGRLVAVALRRARCGDGLVVGVVVVAEDDARQPEPRLPDRRAQPLVRGLELGDAVRAVGQVVLDGRREELVAEGEEARGGGVEVAAREAARDKVDELADRGVRPRARARLDDDRQARQHRDEVVADVRARAEHRVDARRGDVAPRDVELGADFAQQPRLDVGAKHEETRLAHVGIGVLRVREVAAQKRLRDAARRLGPLPRDLETRCGEVARARRVERVDDGIDARLDHRARARVLVLALPVPRLARGGAIEHAVAPAARRQFGAAPPARVTRESALHRRRHRGALCGCFEEPALPRRRRRRRPAVVFIFVRVIGVVPHARSLGHRTPPLGRGLLVVVAVIVVPALLLLLLLLVWG